MNRTAWTGPCGEGWEAIGAYSARIEAPFRTPETRQALATLAAARDSAFASCGRLRLFKAEGPHGGRPPLLLVQPFAAARLPGASAPAPLRAVEAAARLLGRAVGVPPPVACLLRPAGTRRWEGMAVFQGHAGLLPLHDWLACLLAEQNDFGVVRAWARAAGAAIKDLHAAGVYHGNLDGWSIWADTRRAPEEGIRFAELERCVIGAAPAHWRRLRDWAALELPPRLLEEALDAGIGADAPRLCAWRAARRLWRRFRPQCSPPPLDTVPAFLWDAERDVAVDLQRGFAAARPAARTPRLRRRRLRNDGRLFAACEPLAHRLAVGVRAIPETLTHDVGILGERGVRDVWVRLCCHDTDERRAHALAAIQHLAKAGFGVSVLLVQDRRAVAEPGRWPQFISRALGPVGWQVRRAVYGYAPDEAAWGIRSPAEYRRFLQPLAEMRGAFPGIEFAGPACACANPRFVARNAETVARAGGWETWACRMTDEGFGDERLADAAWLAHLGRFCDRARACSDSTGRPVLIVEAAGRTADAAEGKDGAAVARRVRRSLLAVCSGLVEQVVLSQPAGADDWLHDPARQSVWSLFMRRLGVSGRFVERMETEGGDDVWLLRFEDGDGVPVWLGWCDEETRIVTAGIAVERAYDLFGRAAPLLPSPRVRLTPMPVYFDGAAAVPPQP